MSAAVTSTTAPKPHAAFTTAFADAPATTEAAIWTLDPAGRILNWSAGAERLLGYSAAEMIGEHYSRLLAGDGAALETARSQGAFEVVGPLVARGGTELPAATLFTPLVNHQGHAIGFACVARPVGAASPAPDTLTDERFRALVERCFEGINLLDAQGTVLYSSPGNHRLLGYQPEESQGRCGFAFAHPDDLAMAGDMWRRVIENPQHVFSRRIRVRHKDGSWRWTEATVRNLLHVPAVGGVVVNWRDVTDQHQAETELQRTVYLLRAVADGTTDAVFVKDREGRYLLFNEAAARFVNRSVAEVLGQDDSALFDAESAKSVMERDRRVMELGQVETEEEELTAAGVRRTYLSTKAPFRNPAGEVIGLIGISREITERKAAERALRDSEERYRRLVELLPDAVYINCENELVFCNPAFLRLMGAAEAHEVLGKSPFEIFAPSAHEIIRERHKRMLELGQAAPLVECELLRIDGRPVAAHVAAAPISHLGQPAILVVLHDLTELRSSEGERKRLEEQFRQAQKMDAIGQLAGGVAHDFNNLLTVILGFSDLLLGEPHSAESQRESLLAIRAAGERAAALTKQLLAFGRKALIEPRVIDLNETVAQIDKMLRRLIGEDITLQLQLDPALAPVKVDPSQIEQVLINLMVNARDAMPQGGRLTIATQVVHVSPAAVSGEIPPGEYAQLTVTDTGHGMTSEMLLRIFDPFFTTKEAGKGTGLGLAVVHGIVKQSGGHIEVESQLGLGTTFRVLLPAAQEPLPQKDAASEHPPDERGDEAILLVEDEDAVRTIASLALESRGYRVLSAVSGQQALRLVREQRFAPDLLVTDVVMPGQSGPQLAAALAGDFPQVKVLFLSGYTDDAVIRRGIAQPAFLAKPYTARALAHKVREILDRPA